MRYQLTALIAIILLLLSCKENNTARVHKVLSAGAGAYLSSYTHQNIDANDVLYFRLSGSMITADKIGQVVSDDVFSITPKVDGHAYWSDSKAWYFVSGLH